MMLPLLLLALTALFVLERSAQPVRRLLALGLLPVLSAPCTGQMIWARRDPDMSSGAMNVAGSSGSAYDSSRGRHVLFQSESSIFGSMRQRMFAFDGENWTTSTIANSIFLQGLTITEDPTGCGRIVRVAGYSGASTDRWDPTTRSLTGLPLGPTLHGFGAFRYVPGIGAVQFGGFWAFGLADDHTWIWDGSAWSDVTNGPRPSARVPVASPGGPSQLLLFGGSILGGELSDTWSFQGTTWTQLFPTTTPPARGGQGMAYDPLRGRVVMYGGRGAAGYMGDTWEWDGVNWNARTPAHSPPAGEVVSMNWDPLRRRVVLAGITDGSLPYLPNLPIDTWEWDGTDWTRLNPNPTGEHIVTPSARGYHVLTYDTQRQRTVSFGGATGFLLGTRLNDIWEGENGVWQRRVTTGGTPPLASPNAGTALRSNGTLCYVPGQASPISTYNELWRWNGASWSVSPIGAATIVPQHQVLGSFFSPPLGCLLVRLVTTPQWTSQLQVIDPSNGQVLPAFFTSGGPPPLVGSAMVQPTTSSISPYSVWLFGGFDGTTYHSDVWELFDPGFGGFLAWNHLVPPSGQTPVGRRDAAVAFHDGLNRLFVMGGLSPAGVPLGDTWSLDLATRIWTPLGNGPAPRYGAAMTFDASIGRLVLTGGTDGTTVFDDVWEHDGVNWTRRVTAARPNPRNNHSLVYDRTNHRAVLFGGFDGQSARNDTWAYDGVQWTPIVGGALSPSPRFTHAACFVEQGASMVMFGGTDGIGELGDTWRLDQAGQWTPGVSGPPARVNPSMVYAIVQGQPSCLLFGGYLQGSRLGDTWRYLPASDTWQPLAGGPPARDIHAMAWDRLRNVVVMFGGRAVNAFFADDTWEFNCATATWSLRTPAHRPPARWNCTMDFDQSRGRTVMFGGYNGNYLNDVWEWDGSDWQQREPESDGPDGREDAIMAYDSDRGRMEVFGGWNGSSLAGDLWFLSARVDRAGAGNTVNPEALRFHSQPALGQPLQLGFANPRGLGLYTIGLGPVQQPIAPLPVPLMCEPSVIWASTISTTVTATVEPNISLTLPNSPTLAGLTLVFQAFALQPSNCWRATDALQVRL